MRISDWSSDVCSSDLHVEELLAPALLQLRAAVAQQLAQTLLKLVADRGESLLATAMGAAQRLRNDVVDDTEAQQVLGRQAQSLGRLLRLLAGAPENRGAAFWRDHRVDRVLQHVDAVGGGQGDGAAGAALDRKSTRLNS